MDLPSEGSITFEDPVGPGKFVQPNLSDIPGPAQHPGIPATFDFTPRRIVLL
jgi:hypothetical protein